MPSTYLFSLVCWLTPQMGGRKTPLVGLVYTPTARFIEDSIDQQFSVVLRLGPINNGHGDNIQEAELGLLSPETIPEIDAKLQPGRQLLLHEGKRVVAICNVISACLQQPIHR